MPEHTVRQLGKLSRRSQIIIVVALLFSLLLVGYVDARKEITPGCRRRGPARCELCGQTVGHSTGTTRYRTGSGRLSGT